MEVKERHLADLKYDHDTYRSIELYDWVLGIDGFPLETANTQNLLDGSPRYVGTCWET